jgi:hypothetical protein
MSDQTEVSYTIESAVDEGRGSVNKLLALPGIVALALVLTMVLPGATAQTDNSALEARVAGLEARVGNLETQVAALGSTTGDGEATHTLKGDLRLRQKNTGFADAVCQGFNDDYTGRDYSAIQIGNEVRVEDESGTIFGRGELGQGQQVPGDTDWFRHCLMPFEVSGLPDADTYIVFIEGIKDGISYSFDDLTKANWTVHIALGSDRSYPSS